MIIPYNYADNGYNYEHNGYNYADNGHNYARNYAVTLPALSPQILHTHTTGRRIKCH